MSAGRAAVAEKRVRGPSFIKYTAPIIDSLRELGGSGTVDEVRDRVFKVLFQCKRYGDNTSVTPSQVRDFRGAMQGRADKAARWMAARGTRCRSGNERARGPRVK